VGCGGGDIDTDANGRKLAGRARNDCLVGGETLGVDAYVELGGDLRYPSRLCNDTDRDNRHIDSMDWALDHLCSSQNMPALFSAESNRLGNCQIRSGNHVPAPLVTSFSSYCLWRKRAKMP
jgi:hypothetical protein